MKNTIRSLVTEFLLSDSRQARIRNQFEKKRQQAGYSHCLNVYIAIDDPASYLLLQVLPELKQRFGVELDVKTVKKRQLDMFPEPQLWDKNVLEDCQKMAGLYGLKAPMLVTENTQLLMQASLQLVAWESKPDFLKLATSLFDAFWRESKSDVQNLLSGDMQLNRKLYVSQLLKNEKLLKKGGHYLSATINYGDEWYWGLERLQHLENRLNSLIVSNHSDKLVKYDRLHKLYLPFSESAITSQSRRMNLEIFFSVRSPYSYLGLMKSAKLAKHYNISLILKPVLPMMMRGLKVPPRKGLYIALDTKREAKLLGLPFGKIADPLGTGVERCYSLFEYAREEGKEIQYMQNFMRAVWGERTKSETDSGLRKIVEESGLDWQKAKMLINNQGWKNWAKSNLEELYSLGLWGVPCFRFSNTVVFGQDKLSFVEAEIRMSLDLE
ncbi:DsbA family protein [Glaciecola petra]|uniref:DsbA family protein n=1 Tax=Glaciecola petra TaxID=3075602 RepID=A0ABU2ZYH4_9ALTE|nr:DsbA family protein [Aestuariibacter sp. P117]MDT0596482.1 DsbA family protein [Aestuariibacter sp. P117]